MANAGVNPVKPVLSGSKKSKARVVIGLCALVIIVGITITFLRSQNGNAPTRNLFTETLAALSISKLRPSTSPIVIENTINLRAVGDIMMSRSVGLAATKRQNWNWPFEGTTPFLPPVDLTIGNLEFPLTDPCELKEKVMIFCAPTRAVEGLVYGKINVVSLANNHINNYGARGITDTKSTLMKAKIQGVGSYETTTLTVKGKTISFLALDDITHQIDLERIYPIMGDLGARSQVIIVLIHWGNEYEPLPSARQQTIAKALVNSGATIILGTHPHVLQPIAVEGNSLIAYSLGNFIFDQMWSMPTRKSIILDLTLTFTDNTLTHINHESIPITIYDYGQPRIDANL